MSLPHYLRVAGCVFAILASFVTSNIHASPSPSVYQVRDQYLDALQHLRAGTLTAFRKAKEALRDYPLYPYLEYRETVSRLSRLQLSDIEAFEANYADLAVTQRLRPAFLKQLAARRRSTDFLAAYPENLKLKPELACFLAQALHNTGDRTAALELAKDLWLVDHSQDKACDPIFEVLRGSNQFTEQLVWQRLELAISGNGTRLAKYLTGYLTGPRKRWAEELQRVHSSPGRLAQTARYKLSSNASGEDRLLVKTVVRHGLVRLARRNHAEAQQRWLHYADTLPWTAPETVTIERELWSRSAREGVFPVAEWITEDPELITTLAREAVKQTNWPQAERFIEQLPDSEKFEKEWQYWLARTLEENHGLSERATLTYNALADERSYYGFLAAARVGREPAMNDVSLGLGPQVIEELLSSPGVARAVEFLAVGDDVNARREWFFTLDRLPEAQREKLGYVALHTGELRLAISTANRAKLNDHVTLRFPLAYLDQFRGVALETGLPVSLLMAMTRQESAFDRGARSHANARGLMQLLHATAQRVARRIGDPSPSVQSLYDPETNIRLGANYLAWLADRYGGQFPLAAAAYNAGEHRVDRWIKNVEGMPMDVWIENIPFKETRNYVKNVLAFKQVYGELLDMRAPILRRHETTVGSRQTG